MKMRKRQLAAVLTVTLLLLSGCSRIRIDDTGNAALRYSSMAVGDDTKFTQLLTEEETLRVKEFLSAGKHLPTGVGCPFTEEISVAFGGQLFAIGWDGCPTVRLANSDGTFEYYEISQEGLDYITALFEKYADRAN